jgi:hypothetical protein
MSPKPFLPHFFVKKSAARKKLHLSTLPYLLGFDLNRLSIVSRVGASIKA